MSIISWPSVTDARTHARQSPGYNMIHLGKNEGNISRLRQGVAILFHQSNPSSLNFLWFQYIKETTILSSLPFFTFIFPFH